MAVWREKLFVLMSRNAVRADRVLPAPDRARRRAGRAGRNVMTSIQSARSAIVGLSCAARPRRIQHARNATNNSRIAIDAKTTGSRGLTP